MARIAIIGCGLIGQSWATVFAQYGYEVAMYDASPDVSEQALRSIKTRIADLVEFDLIDASQAAQVFNRISFANNLESAVDGAVYVQESGPEQVDLKRDLTDSMDKLVAAGVPIGSSTSGIKASSYSENISGRDRCLVVHPINPPHLIPAVEIVPSEWTDPGIVSTVKELLDNCGRETIVLNREVEGFVVNRLQGALLAEAFKLVTEGIVSGTDLDKAISHGLGMRWSFMGPMQTIHLNAPKGMAQYVERYGGMYDGFGLGPYDSSDWEKTVEEKLLSEFEQTIPVTEIPQAQAKRDRKLMALLRHKKSNPQ